MQQYSTRLWVPPENDCNAFAPPGQTGRGGYPYVADGAKPVSRMLESFQ
jgi:hypothetical protein